MLESVKLFNRALVKGAEIFFMVEELEDKEEAEGRFTVCESNSCGMFNKKRNTCMSCGCLMEAKTKMLKHINVKAKGRIEVTHCPLAEWGRQLNEEAFNQEREIANYYRGIDGKSPI